MATWNTTGELSDVQDKVTNFAAKGDTVLIPPGTYTWGTSLNITKNIKILGDTLATISSGTLPKIIAGTPAPVRFINWQLEDSTPRHTAELGKLHFDGSTSSHKVLLRGVTTIDSSNYTGGIRVHDCRFSAKYHVLADVALPGTASTNGTSTVTFSVPHGLSNNSTYIQRALFSGGSELPTGACIASVPTPTTVTIQDCQNGAMTAPTASGFSVTMAGFIGNGVGGNSGHEWMQLGDWVEGVVDHCEIDINPMRFNGSFGLFNHNSSPLWSLTNPTGTGNDGDYAYFFAPNPRDGALAPSLAGTIHAMTIEDCIMHAGAGGYCDTSAGFSGGGGSIVIDRHNTRIPAVVNHGTRDGGSKHGGRLQESYNNLCCVKKQALQAKDDLQSAEGRDGEILYYNNFCQAQTGASSGLPLMTAYSSPMAAATLTNQDNSRFDYGADGLCVWDDNWTGTRTDRNGFIHYVADFYSHSVLAPAGGFSLKNAVNVLDLNQGDVVVNGVAADPLFPGSVSVRRFSDVYGIVTGTGSLPGTPGSYNAPIKGGGTLTGVTVTFTYPTNPGTIPPDYFRGFALRNADVRRGSVGQQTYPGDPQFIAYSYIHSSTSAQAQAQGGTKWSVTINLVLLGPNPSHEGLPLYWNGTSGHMELRRVEHTFGTNGAGAMSILMQGDPATVAGGGVARYTQHINGEISGYWEWGIKHRVGNTGDPHVLTNWTSSPLPSRIIPANTSIYGWLVEYTGYSGDTQDVVPASMNLVGTSDHGFGKLFARNYKWNPRTTPANVAEQRVGADWGKLFLDHGKPVWDTRSGPSNTYSPEFASFYLPPKTINGVPYVGVGGNLLYPHPLVETPAAQAPVFTGNVLTGSNTFATGVAEDFTVTTSGIGASGPAVITVSVGTLPTGVTLVPSSPPDGTAIIRASTSTVQGNTQITLRADNGTAPAATQVFTIGIFNPSVTLIDPPPGVSTAYPHDEGVNAVVNFKATASSVNGINKIEFYRVPTLPALPVLVGSDSTPDSSGNYTATWTGMADGAYVVKATSYDGLDASRDSATASITVSTNVVAPPTLNPPTIVVTG